MIALRFGVSVSEMWRMGFFFSLRVCGHARANWAALIINAAEDVKKCQRACEGAAVCVDLRSLMALLFFLLCVCVCVGLKQAQIHILLLNAQF